MNKRETITHEDLLKVVSYNVKTGIFVSNRTGLRIGFVKDAKGHRVVEVRGKRYPETRLAVFYVTGEWPVGYVRNKSKRYERYTKFKDLVYTTNNKYGSSNTKINTIESTMNQAAERSFYERVIKLINSIWCSK